MLTVSDDDLGTPEPVWLAWPALRHAPPLELGTPARLVVVAPHPDDEVLAAGGLMREAVRRGVPVTVVAVTDGEASHPGLGDRDLLRARRRGERDEALRCLDVAAEVRHLALPDGGVGQHEQRLVDHLLAVLDRTTVCVGPWRRDGHPDHDATGRAAFAAARRTGAPLVEYPVWAWHGSAPGQRIPPGSLRRLALVPADVAAKEIAIERFGTQIRPLAESPDDPVVLPRAVLARFRRPFETFLVGASA